MNWIYNEADNYEVNADTFNIKMSELKNIKFGCIFLPSTWALLFHVSLLGLNMDIMQRVIHLGLHDILRTQSRISKIHEGFSYCDINTKSIYTCKIVHTWSSMISYGTQIASFTVRHDGSVSSQTDTRDFENLVYSIWYSCLG